MAQIRLEPPATFNFRTPDEWPRWRNRFEQFRFASGLSNDDPKKQVNTLLYCIGEEAESVLSSMNVTQDERSEYDTVLTKFDDFFKVRRNVIFERARFNRRNQREGETSEEYIMELYRLSESCDYGELTSEMIRDRLVVGILDTALSQQLQLDPGLTLDIAKKRIRQREAVGEQHKVLNGGKDEPANIQELQQPDQWKRRGTSKGVSNAKMPNKSVTTEQPRMTRPRRKIPLPKTTCKRCGRESHPYEQCPAKDATCHRCKKKGHYSSMCFTKRISEVTSGENVTDTSFLDTLSAPKNSTWIVDIQLNGHHTNFKLDTGAEVTAISEETYQMLRKPKLKTSTKVLYGPSQFPLKTVGQFSGRLRYKSTSALAQIYVVEGLRRNLLGLPAIIALNLLVRVDASESVPSMMDEDIKTAVFKKFPSLFQGLGNLGEEFEIRLKPDAVPYSLFSPRHVPLPLKPKVQEELNRMESIGVISRVEEPTAWCAGMVVVPKKEGNIRICVDLKPLNQHVLREVHPLPRVDDTLAQLAGARVFSKLDANSGFWQIPLAKKSRLLTTFITPFGRYCFNKMPFGISSAPEHFQKRMSKILSGLNGVLCLMDDVLVFGSSKNEHNSRLSAALKRIQEAGVTLNADKCEFGKTQLKFLGHTVDQDGVRADPDKTSAIVAMSPPTNTSELRRFMGMVNQLGKFSPNLTNLSQPLRALLTKKSTWLWGPEQDRAFENVKAELTKPSVLAFYDPLAPTKVCADASSYGLGAVLLQKKNSSWRPVVYASRSMTETEKRYAQIEKEALATTWACEKFSSYILGMEFAIETDHKPLVPLLGTKHLDSLPPRILRFRLRLSRFNYSISHIPGKLLYTADVLSRFPSTSNNNDSKLQDEVEAQVDQCVTHLPANSGKIDEYRKAQTTDYVCSSIIRYCREGWPEKRDIGNMFIPYWKARGELTLGKNNLLLYITTA